MRYTTFGRTGLSVSRLSMGCNRLGDPGVDPAQWPPIVRRALDLGVTFFDTSNSYNQGRSEAVLGEVTAGCADAGRHRHQGRRARRDERLRESQRSTASTILAAAEDSLKRLRRDAIDLYMLHSPTVRQLETQTWAEAIEKLKAQGQGPLLRHLDRRPRLRHQGDRARAPTSSRSSTTCWTRPPRTSCCRWPASTTSAS